jgi:hypothetical protein
VGKFVRCAVTSLLAGGILAACGAPSAASQFTNANTKLAAAWSRYFDGAAGEQGLSSLFGWEEGTSARTTERVNQWLSRSKHLAIAIAEYDATLGPLAAKSPYRGDVDALIKAGGRLIADFQVVGQAAKQECDDVGCVEFPLGDRSFGKNWSAAQEAETTVYADFGLTSSTGGPYAVK